MKKNARRKTTARKSNAGRRTIARIRSVLVATASTMVLLTAVLDTASFANPLGPSASDPGVTYNGLGTNNTDINLDKSHTIINWDSFNIGQGQTTDFFFGSKNWIVLNRVNGEGSASINGNLNGCLNAACTLYGGNVWVYAADGVLVGSNARVNVGGFLATTSPLASDSAFLSGSSSDSNVFDFGASIPSASVQVKSGAQINASGSVALIAPEVTTEAGSSISAKGSVLYGAAQSYRVKFAQTSSDDLDLVDFEVPAGRAGGTSSSKPLNIGGATTAGNVYIAEVSKQSVADAVINVSGEVTATSASKQGGDIVLSGDGDVNISGQLSGSNVSVASTGGTTTVSGSVTAQQASGAGGDITVTAPNVVLASTARLDASGTAGGNVLIGGDVHGGAKPSEDFSATPVADANTTTVAAGATIMANGSAGNGGNVVVWSNNDTTFNGNVSATGHGGNGGFVETSGSTLNLGSAATVDALSTGGKIGNWLLDPTNWTIANTGGDETPAALVLALHSASVTIAADNNITVTDPVNATGDASATGNLIFEAGNSIFINASITLNGGSFTATANDWSDLGTALADRAAGNGVFQMASGTTIDTSKGSKAVVITVDASATNTASPTPGGAFTPGAITLYGITTGGGAVTINGASGISLAGAVSAGAGTVDLISGSTIDENGGTGSITTTGTLTGSSSGTVTLNGANAVTDLGAFSTSNNNFTLDNGALLITGAVNAGTGTVDLVSTSTIGESGGTITAATLTGSSVGGTTLNDANDIGALGNFTNTTSGAFQLTDAAALTVSGTLDNSGAAADVSLTTTTGNLTITGTIDTNASWVLHLISAGTIDESAGTMTAGALEGSSVGGATFTGTNHIASLYGFSNNGAGGFNFTDAESLVVAPHGTETIDAGTGNLTLTTTTGGISLQANLVAGAANGSQIITLDSAGTISQISTSTITGGELTGFSHGDATFNYVGAANAIGQLGAFNTNSGNFTLEDGALSITGALNAGTGTVDLISTSTIDENGGTGSITAATLTGSSSGSATLTGPNAVGTLSGFTVSTSGGFFLTDTSALDVTGNVSVPGNVYLESSNAGGITFTTGASANLDITSTGSGILSIQSDKVIFSNASTFGTVFSGGTLEYAPDTAGNTVNLTTAKTSDFTANVTTFRIGAVTLPGAGSPTTTAGEIDINSAVTLPSIGLELDAAKVGGGTGDIVFGATLSAGSLLANAAGTIDLNSTAVTTTGGTQEYNGAVMAGAANNLTGTTVTFDSTIDGAFGLTVTGNAVFDRVVGGTTPLTSLDVTGTTTLNSGATAITTSTAQTYGGKVTLGADTTLVGSTVTFDGAVDPAVAHSLTIGNGTTATNAVFDGAVSGLASLLVYGTTDINGGSISTNSTQEYKGAVTLSADADLTGSAITFDSTVDALTSGGESLTTNGATTFDGAVGGTKLSSLLVNGTTDLNGGTVTTTGTQEYNGAATLSADADLTGSAVTFDSTVDALTSGGESLTTNGATTFDGAVGGTKLSSLLVNGTTDLNGGSVTTTGTQEYNGAVTLSADADLTGSAVTFDSTVDALTSGGESLTTNGATTFDGAVGGTKLSSLLVNGTTDLNGGSVTTTGTQEYNGAVTLSADADLTGSAITFDSTVDALTSGGESLTTNGATTFDGVVGGTKLSSLLVNGTTDLNGGTVTTTGTQEYNGAVTLSADADLTGSAITFDDTVDALTSGGESLTTNGATTFDGAVGGTKLSSLLVNGTADLNGGSVSTTGTQEYNGAVTLSADADLTGSAVTLDSTVDALTSGGESLTTNGITTFDGAVGGTKLSSLLVNGTTDINGGSVTTTGTQEYNGAVTLSADADLTGSAVTFDSTVDALTSGGESLTTNGAATFDGAVGGTKLSSVLVNGTTDLNGGSVTTTGTQEYNGAVTLSADADLTGSAVTFDSTVDALTSGGESLTANGATTFDGAVGGTKLSSLLVNGTTDLNGGSVTTTGTQEYNGAVTLSADADLTGSAVTFDSTVDALTSGGESLTTNGATTFDGAVGGTKLSSVLVNGTTDLNGGSVTTTGTQEYNGAVTLSADADLTGSAVTFDSTVDALTSGGESLTTNGATTFDGVVGGTKLSSVLVNGTTDLNGGSVTTAGTQEYNGAVTLSADADLTGSAITFDSTVDALTSGGESLTTNGATTFDGAVGGTKLSSVLVNGTTDLNGGSVTTTGTQEYNGAVTLSADADLTGSAVTFDSTVDALTSGGESLTTNGATTFDGVVGGTKLSSVLVNGTTDLNGGSVTTTGTQEYNGAVTLSADADLTGSAVTFDSTVDALTSGGESLTTNGATTFDGAVGGTKLSSVLVNGTTDLNGGSVTTTGTQEYNGAVTLSGDADLTGSAITFDDTVDALTSGGESLTTNGATTFDGAVGGTKLSSLLVNGTTDLNGGSVSTTGTQEYNGVVTLSADADLTGSAITFGNTVDGAHGLTTTGTTTFNGAVGEGTELASLLVNGTTSLNGGAVLTTGSQEYNGAVTLSVDTELTGSTLKFDSTVDTTHNLTIIGNTTFDGAVGGTMKPAFLVVHGTTDLNGGSVTTLGSQEYDGAVTLSADANLTGSAVQFDSTVDGALSLTTNGATTFSGAVGGTTKLASLLVNGTTDIVGGSITTTGSQEYNGAVTLTLAADLTGSAITFDTTVDAINTGAAGLTTNGATTFNGAVGGTAKLANLLVNGTTDINGGSVSTTGSQEYNGAVTLSADADLTGSAVTFDTTVDGAHNLTVDATTGAAAFDGAVGGTTELTSLTADAGTTITGNTIKVATTLTTNAGTTISITGPVTAQTLTGFSHGTTSITGANAIAILGNFNTNGGNFTLDDGALSIHGALNAGAGTVDLELGSNALDENGGAGTITAHALTGSSGTATLTGANAIATLGNFTTNNGNFTLDDSPLSITGNLNAGSGTVDLVDTSTIDENGGVGTITAATLTGSSVGGATLTGANNVGTIDGFTNTGAGGFSFTDEPTLTISSAINSGSGPLTLTTTGAGDGIVLEADLIAGAASGAQTVTLNSAGSISQTGGTITGGILTANATGGISLTDANQVGTFGDVTNAGSGDVALTDANALLISGNISNAVGAITIVTTGAGNGITFVGDENASTNATFNAAGDFVQTAGLINAANVSITAGGNILIGEPAFTSLVATRDPNSIDQAGNPFFTVSPGYQNHVFITTQQLELTAPDRIVVENTGTPPTAANYQPEGVTIDHPNNGTPALTVGGAPEVIDLFGVVMRSGVPIPPRSIASSNEVAFAGGTSSNNNYRVNGCVIHQLGTCTVVSFSFANFEPAKLADLVLAPANNNEDIEEDLTITGAGNDEIWEEQQ